VKPQDIDVLLAEVRDVITPEQTVLSIAAAIPTVAVERPHRQIRDRLAHPLRDHDRFGAAAGH